MSLAELVTGARLHALYIRSGGIYDGGLRSMLDKLYLYSIKYCSRIDAFEELLTTSRV